MLQSDGDQQIQPDPASKSRINRQLPLPANPVLVTGGLPKVGAGFTLTELMIVAVVVGILVSFALPGFSNLVTRTKLDGGVDKLTQAISFSRSISLNNNAGERTVLCPSGNPESASPSCLAVTETDYDQGWLVFVDCDADSIYDSGGIECGGQPEELLRVQSGLGSLELESTTTDRIVFTNSGRALGSVTFNLNKDGAAYATVVMNPLGKYATSYYDFF